MKDNEFKCAMCKGIFEKAWSEEESLAELKSYFGEISKEDCEVICDDCFQRVHPAKHPEIVNAVKQELTLLKQGVKGGNA